MAESLRRLVNIGSFSILQEKMEKWLDDYHVNSCEQNVTRCCDLIELNARVQAQLFKLLSLSAAEGGAYGGAAVIKSRLLPWLGSGLLPSAGLTSDATLSILADSAHKDREIADLQDMYERSVAGLEGDLSNVRAETDELRNELEKEKHASADSKLLNNADRISHIEFNELKTKLNLTKDELETSKRASTSDKMFADGEVRELRAKLRLAEDELATQRSRSTMVDSYERQVQRLREDLAILSGRKDSMLKIPIDDPLPLKTYTSSFDLPRPSSPFAFDDVTQRVRQQNLITRFNDMFAQDRLDVLDILRRYSDDFENNQRIVFTAVQEAFAVAKLAFTSFKMKVRSNLAISHVGPETLEEAVQDYINRNTDLYDLPALVSDVIRALNRKVSIALPPDVSYTVIQPFIREACKLAWNMSALAHPLDISVATAGELYEDAKYRRSYDSDYTAPLIGHHIWPCLMQGLKVLMKGEAVTRRGAALTPRRSRSPARAMSPTRSVSPSRARSRSPSPRRFDTSLSDRGRMSSRASSRAVTASTSLSHYGVRS